MQEEKVELGFLPLALDTQKPPGRFTPVISEESYYISSIRNLGDGTSAVVPSLVSVNTIPILLAIFIVLILKLVVIKRFNIESVVKAIYQSFGTSFYKNLSRKSTWFCLILMVILMFPVFIFNASFNTQTIVGNADVKIDTLRDIVYYGKSPIFIEGMSMYDLFKAKVTKDYGDVYEKAKAKGFGVPFQLGPIPGVESIKDSVAVLISSKAKRLAPVVGASSGYVDPNQEMYFSERDFHRSLQAILMSHKLAASPFEVKIKKFILNVFESGIGGRMENKIYIDFILSANVFPVSKFDLFKSELSTKSTDLNWKSLNWNGFYQLFYFYIASLIIVIAIQFGEIIIFKLMSVLKTP
ncbi:uncharacterized protein LOC112539539 [Tetranychus urticae]|nr:uncharacterized protein LOC112539539 [Tetranychus urticae]